MIIIKMLGVQKGTNKAHTERNRKQNGQLLNLGVTATLASGQVNMTHKSKTESKVGNQTAVDHKARIQIGLTCSMGHKASQNTLLSHSLIICKSLFTLPVAASKILLDE